MLTIDAGDNDARIFSKKVGWPLIGVDLPANAIYSDGDKGGHALSLPNRSPLRIGLRLTP